MVIPTRESERYSGDTVDAKSAAFGGVVVDVFDVFWAGKDKMRLSDKLSANLVK
jgi:hypothetical protein